ncbi:MAG: hypothetical protein PF630_00595, partial [Gammaproteobacteria bacterium]|nr:hypothetical protein [Gammaproteobacteria bacterium]
MLGALGLFFIFTFTAIAAAPVVPGTLWVADSDAIAALDNEGSIILEITTERPVRAVAFDRDRGIVWALDDRGELAAFDLDGVPLTSTMVVTPPGLLIAPGAELLMDAPTDTLWLLAGNTLYRFDEQGAFQDEIELAASEQPRGLALDEARSRLWLATRRSLLAFDPSGANTLNIEADLPSPGIDAIAFDPFLDALWVAGGGRVQRYDGDGNQVFDVAAERPIKHIAADGWGGAWLARPDILHHIDEAGGVDVSVRPQRDIKGSIAALVADATDGSVWVAGPKHLGRYALDGSLQIVTDRDKARLADLEMVRAPAVLVRITKPEVDAQSNQNPPEVRLVVEGLSVSPERIVLTDFGVEIQANCEALAESEFLCSLADELPQGENQLVAAVTNAAGTRFESAPLAFVIDSIPPEITIDFPPAGHVTNVQELEMTGSVSEEAELIINSQAVTVGDNLSFQTTIELEEGPNTIILEAHDPADNLAIAERTVTLDTVPPAAPDPTRISVAATGDGQVHIIGEPGSVEALVLVTVTNQRTGASITVQADAAGAFSAQLEGVSGDSFFIIVQDAAGNTGAGVELGGTSTGNQPPHFAAIPDQVASIGQTLTLNLV